MWRTDTYWFDVALVAGLLMLGEVLFSRFAEHRSRARRALKAVVGAALFVGISVLAGRGWMFVAIGATLALLAAVHGWWLPRHGVNGWTAEPRPRYFALLGLDPDGRRR